MGRQRLLSQTLARAGRWRAGCSIVCDEAMAGYTASAHSTSTHHGAVDDAAAQLTEVVLTGAALTIVEVVAVARHGARVGLDEDALATMAVTRGVVEGLAEGERPHYGVSTGFGALARLHIPTDQRARLQVSLVRSHAAGTGPEVETEVIRALQLLRLATLMTGRTGARPVVARCYAAMLNARLTPVVHEYGSLGCSGDLAPLAHVALAAMGEGEVRTGDGTLTHAAAALAEAGIEPLVLREKEGLALINGTDGMLGHLCLALADLDRLTATADVAAAMSVEALLGTDRPFAPDMMTMRPHPGQAASAANLQRVLAGSQVMASHRRRDEEGHEVCTRVQDAYSLRCAPQVHGAARDTATHAEMVAQRELASAIDNPVVTPDGRVESNGNFHGAPIAYVLDFLAIAVADLASISERRIDRFLDRSRSEGLPPFLAHEPGVDSGLMIAQYTAAAIVSELKRLASPASVDSIPSSAMQEDHVSMGWAAARKLRRAIDGLRRVIAIEVLTASRGLELRQRADAELVPAAASKAVRGLVLARVGALGSDRFLSPQIETVVGLVSSGALLQAVVAQVGTLD